VSWNIVALFAGQFMKDYIQLKLMCRTKAKCSHCKKKEKEKSKSGNNTWFSS
jgi:hypothetical protein